MLRKNDGYMTRKIITLTTFPAKSQYPPITFTCPSSVTITLMGMVTSPPTSCTPLALKEIGEELRDCEFSSMFRGGGEGVQDPEKCIVVINVGHIAASYCILPLNAYIRVSVYSCAVRENIHVGQYNCTQTTKMCLFVCTSICTCRYLCTS